MTFDYLPTEDKEKKTQRHVSNVCWLSEHFTDSIKLYSCDAARSAFFSPCAPAGALFTLRCRQEQVKLFHKRSSFIICLGLVAPCYSCLESHILKQIRSTLWAEMVENEDEDSNACIFFFCQVLFSFP